VEEVVVTIYREEIPLVSVKWLAGLFGLLAIGFGYALAYQVSVGPIGRRPAPDWFWALMAAMYVFLTALIWNFRHLTVEITDDHIAVGFGIFRRAIPWRRVAGVHRDASSLLSYGGVGWRIGRRKGGWVMAFVDFRSPRIVVELRGGRVRELVFSTRDPEKVQRVIAARLESHAFPNPG
jgi:hypothetical protein